jgi:hypothetical protein
MTVGKWRFRVNHIRKRKADVVNRFIIRGQLPVYWLDRQHFAQQVLLGQSLK